jgi:hypothetical protein
MPGRCATCGHVEDLTVAACTAADGEALRYDLEDLVVRAAEEKAYDETVRIRVTQQDIRHLVERRRRTLK